MGCDIDSGWLESGYGEPHRRVSSLQKFSGIRLGDATVILG